jgi:WD40 repeat protein
MLHRFETFGVANHSSDSPIALSPNGRCVVVSVNGGPTSLPGLSPVRVWDIETGALLQSYSGPMGRVNGVAWSADGRFVAAAFNAGKGGVYIWRASTAAVAAIIPTTAREPVSWAVAYSRDRKFIAYGDDSTLVVRPISEK